MSVEPSRASWAKRSSWPTRQWGWGASEYVSVLMGLIVVWEGAARVLTYVREHHDEFLWVLMIPF